MKGKNNYIKFTTILFLIYMLSLLFCGAFFYYRIQALNSAIDLVGTSIRIKQKIKQVETDVSKSESAQRGFLLTDDSIFLEHWQAANTHALNTIDTINILTADNPEQADYADKLKDITLERLGLLRKTMEFKNEFTNNPDLKKEYLLNGKKTMDSLLSISRNMDSIENNTLEKRRQSRDNVMSLTPKYVLGILLFSVLIISVCFFAILRFYK